MMGDGTGHYLEEDPNTGMEIVHLGADYVEPLHSPTLLAKHHYLD